VILNLLHVLDWAANVRASCPQAHECLTGHPRRDRRTRLTAMNQTNDWVNGLMDPFEYSVGKVGACDELIRSHEERLLLVVSLFLARRRVAPREATRRATRFSRGGQRVK
jgi:hypothetical protein